MTTEINSVKKEIFVKSVLSETEVKQQIYVKVNAIFSDLFDLTDEQLIPHAHIYADLGLDSLDTIDLMIAFEKNFQMKPIVEEARSIETLQDIYNLVLKYYENSQTIS